LLLYSLNANLSSSTPLIVVGAGTEQYTQDVAVIDIDASKIDTSRFEPRSMILFPLEENIIDLGSKFFPKVLTRTADASEPQEFAQLRPGGLPAESSVYHHRRSDAQPDHVQQEERSSHHGWQNPPARPSGAPEILPE
jgi:hypothetical protein